MDTTTSNTTTEMNISSLDLGMLLASRATFLDTPSYVALCVAIGNSFQTKYPAFDRWEFYATCDFDSALGTEWRDWNDWE